MTTEGTYLVVGVDEGDPRHGDKAVRVTFLVRPDGTCQMVRLETSEPHQMAQGREWVETWRET